MTHPPRKCSGGSGGYCGKPATVVCTERDTRPLEWFACDDSAHQGAHLGARTTPIATWFERHGLAAADEEHQQLVDELAKHIELVRELAACDHKALESIDGRTGDRAWDSALTVDWCKVCGARRRDGGPWTVPVNVQRAKDLDTRVKGAR